MVLGESQALRRGQARRRCAARFLTRLASAYNAVTPPSGKSSPAVIDANELKRPRRFLRRRAQTSKRAARYNRWHALIDTAAHGRRHIRRVQGHRQHGNPSDRASR